jgi:hypothetical protein
MSAAKEDKKNDEYEGAYENRYTKKFRIQNMELI